MISFSCENGKAAVDCLGQDDTHQLMRKGETGKGDALVARRLDAWGKPVGRADDKGELAAFVDAARKKTCQSLGAFGLVSLDAERKFIRILRELVQNFIGFGFQCGCRSGG